MPAIIAQDSVLYTTQSDREGGGVEKISEFTQTEIIKMVEILAQTMVEMSTQTEKEEGSAVLTKFVSTQIEDRQDNIIM